MVIEYERKIEDMLEFNQFHLNHSSTAQQQIRLSTIIVAVFSSLGSLGVIYAIDADKSLPFYAYIISIAGGIIAFFIYPPFHRWYVKNQAIKFLGEGNNRALLGQQRIAISPEGLLCESNMGQSKVNWLAIQNVEQNEKYFFIYIAATNAIVIPKSAFLNNEEQSRFLEMVNNKGGAKRTPA